jgi:hypothetical protein
MTRLSGLMLAIVLQFFPVILFAQNVPVAPTGMAASSAVIGAIGTDASGKTASIAACDHCIPPLTPVELTLDADLGSKISKTGDIFPFHLANGISIDGHEIVPAGTQGQGEVVHAKKAGGSGTSGELVLAARFLAFGSERIKLRSMHIQVELRDAINKVDAFNAASVMSPVPVGIIGFAVTGHNQFYPKGTVVTAKTAELFPATAPRGSRAPTDQPGAEPYRPEGVQ